jgi:hypothetical protein
MKKLLKIPVLVLIVGLVLGFVGCSGDEDGDKENKTENTYAKYYSGTFRNNNKGTVEVVNNTHNDMLLFIGETISLNYIVGGVKAGTRNTINFSDRSDYQVGGYVLLRAVKQTEFNTAKDQSRVDHTAMVTYGEGRRYTTNILSTTDGAYRYMVHNRSRDYGLELRRNSPEGDKVAYLTKGEVRRIINTPDRDPATLYPVWVAFNNVTKTIVSFAPKGVLDYHDVQGSQPPAEPPNFYFPDDGTNVNIVFPDVVLPFATITVRNNQSRLLTFNSGTTPIRGESQQIGITSGMRDSYEIRSTGEGLNLNISIQTGAIVIPVRFQTEPGASTVTVQNGYAYTVAFNLKPGADASQAASYEAWLSAGTKMNTSDLLVSN